MGADSGDGCLALRPPFSVLCDTLPPLLWDLLGNEGRVETKFVLLAPKTRKISQRALRRKADAAGVHAPVFLP